MIKCKYVIQPLNYELQAHAAESTIFWSALTESVVYT